MSDDVKYFLCTGRVVKYQDLYKHVDAHIIGHLATLTDEGRKVTGLALWDQFVPTDVVPPVAPTVRAYLVGDARGIRCGLCGRVERWEIGKAAFLALMGRIFDERLRDEKETS